MALGTGIFLIAVGAILAFAVTATIGGVSLTTIGIILMIVGALGIALEFALLRPRRTTVAPTVVEERRHDRY